MLYIITFNYVTVNYKKENQVQLAQVHVYRDHKVGLPLELFSLRFMITDCIGVKPWHLKSHAVL